MKRLAGLALVALLGACTTLREAPAQPQWVGVWGASPTPPPANAKTFENQTVRQVLRVSAAGSRVRVRLHQRIWRQAAGDRRGDDLAGRRGRCADRQDAGPHVWRLKDREHPGEVAAAERSRSTCR